MTAKTQSVNEVSKSEDKEYYVVQEQGRNCLMTVPPSIKDKYKLSGGSKVRIKDMDLEVIE
jgi:hypothetical protein